MRDEGIGSWTARRARRTPDATAVVHRATRHTYAQLHERSTRLAHHLLSLGVRRGDRVAFLAPNHPAYLEALFAAGQVGAVFVPLNTRLTESELEHCLRDAGPEVLIHNPASSVARSSTVPVSIPIDAAYERVVADGPPPEPVDEAVSLEDPCLILYTSGTAGRPKGALLTHGNITWNCVNILIDGEIARDEVALVNAPLFHAAALGTICLPTLLKGGVVVLEAAFDAGRTLDLIESLRVTLMFGVPTMYQALAAHPRFPTADLSSIRSLTCGGAPVAKPLIRAYLERGLCFIQGYGATEASPGALMLDREHAWSKAGTAGVPHFFTDVRVTGPDGAPAEVGERGEIEVQGPNVMRGYWGEPEEPATSAQERWFQTGDVGIVDGDGYVEVVDRIKDVIISGGENVYPAEVESVLCSHPAVAECAVIGVPDESWGEVGQAIVVPNEGVPIGEPTARLLLEHLGERLARYKIPKSVVFVDELPHSGAGKVLKSSLREKYGAS